LKKKEERALFKNRISAATESRREIEAAKKRPDLGEGWRKSVRTVSHVRHFPDLPGGEITIEGSSTVKHCTTTTKKRPKIKLSLKKKKRREHCSTIELLLPQKEEGKQKQPKEDRSWRGGGEGKRVYVLYLMVVTFPTCHLERSLLKPPAV
jgi:hypothetical protein